MNEHIQSPLAHAKGTGSAHAGSAHWLHQRITAVSNLFLVGWLAWSGATMKDWSYAGFTAWLAQVPHAVPFILAVISVCYHAALGTQVVAEDYIHGEGRKMTTLIFLRLYFTATAVTCIFSILKIGMKH